MMRTPLGTALKKIREKAIAEGIKLKTASEILEQIAERRSGQKTCRCSSHDIDKAIEAWRMKD